MELSKLVPSLVVKYKETTELLTKIAVDQAKVDKVKLDVEVVMEQQDTQKDFDKALPTLNKSDITEVKNMARPSPGVALVLKAVIIWRKIKSLVERMQKVAKTMEHKKVRLAEMNAQLDAANATLQTKQDQLIDKTLGKKIKLEFESDQCKSCLIRTWPRGRCSGRSRGRCYASF